MSVVRDVEKEEVQKTLPCVGCKLSNLCKYAGNIAPVDNTPEIFEVHYVCTEKEKYN